MKITSNRLKKLINLKRRKNPFKSSFVVKGMLIKHSSLICIFLKLQN